MPRKELRTPRQIEDWLTEWGRTLSRRKQSGGLVLIGSAALLWHVHALGLKEPLPEESMDADPIPLDDCVVELGYECQIGSEFEAEKGWHINLMPEECLLTFPPDWRERVSQKHYESLMVTIPSPHDLVVPKRKRGESRDRRHIVWARQLGLLPAEFSEFEPSS